MARTPVFSRSTNPESKLIDFFILLKVVANSFGSLPPFTVCKIGDYPHFLLALPSNNQFAIKLVEMGIPHVVVGTLKISLDELKKKKFSRVLQCQ